MVDITIKDINGWQARYLLKLADMMKASEVIEDRIEIPYTGAEPINIGKRRANPEEFANCGIIQEIIDNDPLY